MKRLFLAVFAAVLLASGVAFAQEKCEGPAELCAQILQLKTELDANKKAASDARMAKATDEKQIANLQEQQKSQEMTMVKFMGAMGTMAVVLKIILSLLTQWKDSLFKSDKGKAGIRIAILGVTLGVFLTTNMGFGIPWWQALILAAGGPLSMIIHEMAKLIPVMRGKKKLEEAAPAATDQPPPDQPAT